uniref:uncharacterized protein LOC101963847 n=1 Tax=Ictidomys tridecemlineatus TaxID=43179 RepID=UPI001A9E3555|nr:uncharacterized protein LOC101963847 [Ictidomys tridecemlineatus]
MAAKPTEDLSANLSCPECRGIFSSTPGSCLEAISTPQAMKTPIVTTCPLTSGPVNHCTPDYDPFGSLKNVLEFLAPLKPVAIRIVRNAHGNKTGPLSELHYPIDSLTKKPKGFAFVTFMFPEHAVKAYAAVDGQVFQETKGSVAVRVALGETQLVQEVRRFLIDNGVSLDSFSQPVEEGAEAPTAKTEEEEEADEEEDDEESLPGCTLFIKNLNFSTTEETLQQPSSPGRGPGESWRVGQGDLYPPLLSRPALTSARKKQLPRKQTSSKILVRNIPFQADRREIRELFSTFGELKTVRLPKKMTGTGTHRGFGFVDFLTKQDAKRAFNALCHSTHLYGRRLVLEWADSEVTLQALRRKTAEHFHGRRAWGLGLNWGFLEGRRGWAPRERPRPPAPSAGQHPPVFVAGGWPLEASLFFRVPSLWGQVTEDRCQLSFPFWSVEWVIWQGVQTLSCLPGEPGSRMGPGQSLLWPTMVLRCLQSSSLFWGTCLPVSLPVVQAHPGGQLRAKGTWNQEQLFAAGQGSWGWRAGPLTARWTPERPRNPAAAGGLGCGPPARPTEAALPDPGCPAPLLRYTVSQTGQGLTVPLCPLYRGVLPLGPSLSWTPALPVPLVSCPVVVASVVHCPHGTHTSRVGLLCPSLWVLGSPLGH